MRNGVIAAVSLAVGVAIAATVLVETHHATRNSTDPHLQPVAAEAGVAKRLLLTIDQLPNGFQADFARAAPNIKDDCDPRPNLSGLTATAEAYGRGWLNGSAGAAYSSEAIIFVSPAEAARAEELLAGPWSIRCTGVLINRRIDSFRKVVARVPRPTESLITRRINAVDLRSRQAIVRGELGSGVSFSMEASLIFLRHGSALVGLWVVEPHDKRTRRIRQDVVAAVLNRLQRSRF